MRFFTYVLCGLAWFVAQSNGHCQLLRVFRGRNISTLSCANGSCAVPTYLPGPQVQADPCANGVCVMVGAKATPKQAAPTIVGTAKKKAPGTIIEQAPIEDEEEFFFGVDWEKIANKKYDDKAKKISLIEAFEFAQGNYDDAKVNLRFIVIGTKEERAPFEAAYRALPADERAKISPWFVAADHWSMRDSDGGELRYVVDGKPTVYVLAPNGEPIHRQDGGTASDAVEAIRKGGKKYDPKRDPDLRKTPDPLRVPAFGWRRTAQKLTPVALVCGTACFVGFMFRRRSS